MKSEKIVSNLTLEEYKRKYKNSSSLMKVTKEEVREFDKIQESLKYNKAFNVKEHNHLLKNRKWLLIDDTYYEIPKPFRWVWFRNLNAGIQIAACSIACVGVASAVTFPALSNTIWKKEGPTPSPEPEIDPEWTKKENWYELTSNATADDIGKTVKVKVNGLDHEVTLIDVDKDTDENGNKIHTTWEFTNFICDERGYSLAYQYRDCVNVIRTDKPGDYSKWIGKSLDYNNSSINYALTGHGTNGFKNTGDSYYDKDPTSGDDISGRQSEILVARYPVTDEEKTGTEPKFNWFKNTEEYKTKYEVKYNYAIPVIDMLPKKVTAKFKQVSKVNNEKLFLLSGREIDGGYSYYKYHGLKSRIRRIKHQIYQKDPETGEQYVNDKAVAIGKDDGQLYKNSGIAAQAGRNSKINIAGSDIYGGYYWCRDVGATSGTGYQYLNRVAPNGRLGPGCPITDAYAIAPAFCI